MIKLACNYYPEVIELVQESKIQIDYVKYPALGYHMSVFENKDLTDYKEFVHNVRPICPIMLHGLGAAKHNIGSKTFREDLEVNLAREAIRISDVNGVSIHLSGIDVSLTREENKEILINNIIFLKNVFADAEFVTLENIHGSKRHDFGDCMKPDFIAEVLNGADAGFLLDISHAYATAKVIGMDFYEYLNRLPLHRVYEIHINGWIEQGEDLMAHTKINDIGYEALEYVLTKTKPSIVTLEYGRDTDRLQCGIPLMSAGGNNNAAKEEIVEQIHILRGIIKKSL